MPMRRVPVSAHCCWAASRRSAGRAQPGEIAHVAAELLAELPGARAGLVHAELTGGRRALHERACEQAARGRHREQRDQAARARALAEDRDARGIAAERGDLAPDEAQRLDLVEQAEVRPARAQRQEAERAHAVVQRHHDHVAAAGERCALIRGPRGGSGREGAAVQPHHDRAGLAGRRARPPHVQREAVLALGVIGQQSQRERQLVARLGRRRAVRGAVAQRGPRRRRLGRLEAQRAHRRSGVRNAEEPVDAVLGDSAHGPEARRRERHAHFVRNVAQFRAAWQARSGPCAVTCAPPPGAKEPAR
jgi:hypothetical protein